MDFIHHFAIGASIDNVSVSDLGNKGANLAKMCSLGFNVPEGFIISSQLCDYYYRHNKQLPKNFDESLRNAIAALEQKVDKKFGGNDPLLVSVRSGAAVSMPGMMDTILNVGFNDDTVLAVANKISENFAFDCYRRFLESYGTTVLGIAKHEFEYLAHNFNNQHLDQLTQAFKQIITKCGYDVGDPYVQLKNSIISVLESWYSDRAQAYRQIHNIGNNHGTAIVVQRMVFGNMNHNSGTGVVFSRNPVNGNKELYGEFLANAQGEDVVAGTHNPVDINSQEANSLKSLLPSCYQELQEVVLRLEKSFGDMQDVEFTIEDNRIYILQTRSGKRTTSAAIKIAVDMVEEGLKNKSQALKMLNPEDLSQLMHLFVDYSKKVQIIAKGLPASPGSAAGSIVFSSEEAERLSQHMPVILVRQDTSPEDIKGMHYADGILTSRGGMTSHAAVVARGMGKPCVCGASSILIDTEQHILQAGGLSLKAGDYITIDGSSGNIILGQAELTGQKLSCEFYTFMQWVDELRSLKVRANAENPIDIKMALEFGAEGIGLCRTEHMLFEQERLKLIRQIILTQDVGAKLNFIDQLFLLHKEDFKQIFTLCHGLDVNVRLFDPPLHEFLPFENFATTAQALGINEEELRNKVKAMHESNPMLGNRGCRLGITMPDLYQMQVRALFEAAIELKKQQTLEFNLEVMLPFIATLQELEILVDMIRSVAGQIQEEQNAQISYKVGMMIELPRAALIAEKFASLVDYFSFGTNDLTQMTFGLSRDDMGSFAQEYKSRGIFQTDPFISIDQEGVGQLIALAATKGRGVNQAISLSVCGEHGGDPQSIRFFNQLGLNYVSCSPFRVIIAKLAAAQANL